MKGNDGKLLEETLTMSNTAETVEILVINIDIGLVNFISNEDKALIVAEMNDINDILIRETLACRITGIDDYKTTNTNALLTSGVEILAKDVNIKTPTRGLVEVVGDEVTAIKSESGTIKGILRNGDHKTIIRVFTKEEIHHVVNGRGSTISHEKVIGVTENAIAALDSLSNQLTNDKSTGTLAVGTNTARDIFKNKISPLNNI
mmetsp:Transcript_21282/g.38039  ORF Transcript_21282/g.38039 Transcript_21282/m.38039 type:complete len:204 (-) Transcript_21282:606-1217(-)